ncbi:hypothetical protein [Ectropis obliqua nucleopolyhedrovirus]|uniref:Uncharacterized protein n=1 Tax=Ectropis obliqua nucleopolyhedrovirus TaxID=59376 RepID=A0EZ08_9ABAC|nr:hypothetical protein EONV_gp105 [Ectropis obliqua nucleopolyhedrovirus]ABI35788.1 hypothetical protein [Ectropis obliqua nucleopolyhedrovirus]QWV59628.1 hypothetical protein EONV_gp105 [Ectropis obliqua nucleopolyhedrovirus]UYO72901.1 hypothetical protein EONV-gp105 [Ectropis obliqua nucleopolyhedrovirus]
MHISAYTIELITRNFHNVDIIDTILKEYFCPVFVLHSRSSSCAVCEDQMCVHSDNSVTYKMYENYLQNERSNMTAVIVHEYGSLENVESLIVRCVERMGVSRAGDLQARP